MTFVDRYCPYCGEPISLAIDDSAGDQQYIEDCQVCCRPIDVHVAVDDAKDDSRIAHSHAAGDDDGDDADAGDGPRVRVVLRAENER